MSKIGCASCSWKGSGVAIHCLCSLNRLEKDFVRITRLGIESGLSVALNMFKARLASPALSRFAEAAGIGWRGHASSLLVARSDLVNRHSFTSASGFSDGHGSRRSSPTGETSNVNRALALCTAASSTAFLSWNTFARPLHADAAPSIVADVAPVLPKGPVPKQDMRITLYQYDVCPFCNKVRAYLDFHKIPYSVVEVDPMGKKELAHFSQDYRKVPIAVVNDVQVNGSADIIGAIGGCVFGDNKHLSPLAASREREWLTWVDDHLIHLISPNIYRSPTESLQAFDYIVENAKFTAWQRMSIRYSGALAMYMVAKKIKKKHNIQEPRSEMYEAINKWTDAVEAEGGAFLAGKDGPGTADLAVFGVLRAIKNFDTFEDIKQNCSAFEAWFERTQTAVGDEAIVGRS